MGPGVVVEVVGMRRILVMVGLVVVLVAGLVPGLVGAAVGGG